MADKNRCVEGDDEARKRMDEIARRMLNTPPKPHKERAEADQENDHDRPNRKR